MGEVVVWDGNCSGTHYSINKSISTIRQWIMVNPDVAWSKNRNAIPISHGPPSIMRWGASNHGVAGGLTVMNVNSMDDNICDKLDGDAGPISDMHIGTTTINCLKTVHYKLLLQSDHHVTLEHNPKRPVLDNSMAEGAWFGVHRVIIARVTYHIVPSITTTNGIASKANATVCKAFSPKIPTPVTAPAVINWIPCSTWEISQISPFCAISYAPEKPMIITSLSSYITELIKHVKTGIRLMMDNYCDKINE